MRNKKLCSLLWLCQSVNYIILFEYHHIISMYKWVSRLISTSIFVWTKSGLWYRCVIRTRLYIGFTRLCIKVIASSDISAWVVDTFRKVAISRCSWYISRGLDLNHLYRFHNTQGPYTEGSDLIVLKRLYSNLLYCCHLEVV